MKRLTLGDVCKKESSNIAQKNLQDKKGAYPIYGASGLIKQVDFYQQDKEYIAVVKDGAGIGRTMLLPAYSSVIGTMQYLLPKEGIPIDIKYLFYAVEHMNLAKYFSGATIPHIYFRDYQKEPINIPDIETQRKISQIFGKIDALITSRKEQRTKLDQIVKSRFIEMFGDCIDNPKGWKTKCLEDIAEVGSSKRVFIEELQEAGIPFYRGTEVGALAEGKQISPELFITEEHYTELCKATDAPQIGDLLMPSICPDGRIWVVNTEDPFYFKDGRVLWVHAIDNSYNPVFLLYTLKDRIMADYSSIASGTTFAELKIFALKKCRIFDVPIELQNQFAAFVVQTDKSKYRQEKCIRFFQCLEKTLDRSGYDVEFWLSQNEKRI